MNPSARSYQGVPAEIHGGEVSYTLGLTRSLLLAGSVSYTSGFEYAIPGTQFTRRNMAEMSPLKSRAYLRYGRSRYFAQVNGLASAPQDKIDSTLGEQRTAGYALMGIMAGVHTKRVNFAAGVENLLNRYYYDHLSFQRDPYRSGVRIPEPGRTLYLNISLVAY
jgi:iron complex outermembrane receptor protein